MTRINWRTGSEGVLGSSSFLARSDWTIECLQELGIKVPPGSRLLNARRLIRKVQSQEILLNADDHALLEAVADAHQTLWEFFVITYAAWMRRRRPNHPFPKVALEGAVLGADLRSFDRNSKARDTQFELFVAALLTLGGAEIQWGEPDLRLLYWEEYVGLAVKRMKTVSTRAIIERILDGARQIRREKLEGFVVLNLDLLLADIKLDEQTESRHRQLSDAMAVVEEVVHRKLRDQAHVKGIMVIASVARWDFGCAPPALPTTYAFLHHVIAYRSEDQERGRLFFDGLTARIDNALTRLVPRTSWSELG